MAEPLHSPQARRSFPGAVGAAGITMLLAGCQMVPHQAPVAPPPPPRKVGRYELRTTDVDAAHGFYADLLAPDLWGEGIDVQPMPSQATRRGAPPHWLGHIGVDDIVGTALRFIEAGGKLLGQPPGAPIPYDQAVLRVFLAQAGAARGRSRNRGGRNRVGRRDRRRNRRSVEPRAMPADVDMTTAGPAAPVRRGCGGRGGSPPVRRSPSGW